MREFVVRVQQTKDYVFTMVAEDDLDAWENDVDAAGPFVEVHVGWSDRNEQLGGLQG